MKPPLTALFGLLFFLFASILEAAEIPNGIYQVLLKGGTLVKRSDGSSVHLGKMLSKDFGKAKMWSSSNRNTVFRLELNGVKPFDTSGQFAMYVEGVCEVIGGRSARTGQNSIDLMVGIYGRANAEEIARYFDIEPNKRKHPGHKLTVGFEPTQASYVLGRPVVVELVIENAGNKTVRFSDGGKQRGARNNQFSFICSPALPDTGDGMNFGGMMTPREIEPGGAFRKKVDLTKWFQFKRSGSLSITGLYEMELLGEDRSLSWEEILAAKFSIYLEDAAE